MEASQPDTDELLRAAEQGDDTARQYLLARHRSRLRQMVAVHLDRRLAARIDPSDVVQETGPCSASAPEPYAPATSGRWHDYEVFSTTIVRRGRSLDDHSGFHTTLAISDSY